MAPQLNTNNYRLRLVIAGGAFLCFAFITFQISTHEFLEFDTVIREWVYSQRSPMLNSFFIPATYLGNWQTIVGLCLILLIIPKTRKSIGIPVSCSALVSVCVYKLVKMAFQRPRPDISLHLINQGGYSFPSGHSMNCILFYGVLIFLIRKNCSNRKVANALTVILTLLIFIIGFSRVYVGVHFPTDVLGGWSLGLALAMIATIIIDKLYGKKQEA